MNAVRKVFTAAVAALAVTAGSFAMISDAEAGQRRHYSYSKGSSAGPVIAGMIGGLALGALAASARPSYGYSSGYGYGYARPYSSGYAYSGYADAYEPRCFVQKQHVYDSWGNYAGKRAVRVCQ
jgi:hypothetical protein